jgi:hypothetical protein
LTFAQSAAPQCHDDDEATIAAAGSWAFEAVVAKVGSYEDVWLATKGEIAAHVRQVLR